MNKPRIIKDGPFCWASKAALTRILEATGDAEGSTQRARSVYLALCELASDQGSERVTAAKTLIAYRAGMSVRSVQRVLPDLKRAGVVTVQHNAYGNGTVSAYTLLKPTGHKDSTSGHNGQTPSQPDALRLADKVKELKERKEPIAPAKPTRERNPLLDALAAIDGSDPAQRTGPAWGAVGTALKAIREVCPDLTPAEISRRAANYRQHMPGAMLTANALAKHWATCDRPPQSTQPAQQPARNYPLLTA